MGEFVQIVGFGLVASSIIALAGVGFTLQFSVSRIFNFAYGAVMSISAYVAYVANVTLGWNIWLAVATGAACGAILSIALLAGVLQPFMSRHADHFTLLIASFAAGMVITSAINAIWGLDAHSYNVRPEPAVEVWEFLWTPRQMVIMGLTAVSLVALHVMLRYSRFGKAMRAVANNADLAGNCGVNARNVTVVAWGIAGTMCGLAGVTLALSSASFHSEIGTALLLIAVTAALVGGVGDPYGAMLGALAVGLSTELFAWLVSPGMKNVVAFAVLGLILIFRPQGLWSGKEQLRAEARAESVI